MITLAHRRLALLAATLMWLGLVGGCQTSRQYSAAQEPVGSTSLRVAAQETRPPAGEPPFLRGPSEPVPLVTAEESPTRAIRPRGPAENYPSRSQERSGPSLRSPAEDADDDDDDDDAPTFPQVGRRSVKDGQGRDPASAAAGRHQFPFVDHAGRAESAGTNGRRDGSLPLPVTRRLPSSGSPASVPQTTPSATAARPFPVTEPVRLADPPALIEPPTERR